VNLPDSGTVAVFPLPNAVLFPQTVLPLHIFEPRYREMVRDAQAGDGMIAIALLESGFEKDYEGSPAIHTLGTIGRIDQLERLPDGRSNLNLVGLVRVELHEIPSSKSYRQARFTALPEAEVDERDPEILSSKLELMASQGYLMREITDGAGTSIPLIEDLPYASAVNGSCANLPSQPAVRQELLALDDLRERHRRVSGLINEILERVLELKDGAGGHGAN
jgi:Lon protease-like protein